MVLIMCFRFQAGINKSSFASITSERGRFLAVSLSMRGKKQKKQNKRLLPLMPVIVGGIALISRVD